ncbi:MAG: DUF47 family protein [Rhabdochlamydiaceae bacterium]|nr:DUF47 family protein [Rhabdochlamydiaceae bacterium]
MKFSLLPREALFYDLLGNLVCKAESAVKLFKELISSWDPSHPAIQELKDVEHACDQIVHEIMVKLNKTFITPIDREDIHSLAKKIDDLVDIVQALSKRMVLFNIQEISAHLTEMVVILEKSVVIVVAVVQKIREMKNTTEIFDLCIQIHTLENQGDRVFEKALGDLFQNANTANSLDVIKWKEIYDFSELAIDKCEDIADVIWGIVVKYG